MDASSSDVSETMLGRAGWEQAAMPARTSRKKERAPRGHRPCPTMPPTPLLPSTHNRPRQGSTPAPPFQSSPSPHNMRASTTASAVLALALTARAVVVAAQGGGGTTNWAGLAHPAGGCEDMYVLDETQDQTVARLTRTYWCVVSFCFCFLKWMVRAGECLYACRCLPIPDETGLHLLHPHHTHHHRTAPTRPPPPSARPLPRPPCKYWTPTQTGRSPAPSGASRPARRPRATSRAGGTRGPWPRCQSRRAPCPRTAGGSGRRPTCTWPT